MTQTHSASPPVKVGIVGTGAAAKRRAAAFREDERSHIVAVSGHTWEHTKAFCEEYSGAPVETWQALVNMPSLDLVVICTINQEHGKIARAALEAQKHVVVEYPLALVPSEAQALITLAQAKEKLLHVEHIELLGGLHQAIRESLPKIGEVYYARYATIISQRPAPRRWTYHREMFGFPLCAALSRIHRLTDLFGTVDSVSCQSRFWDASDGYFTACLCSAQLRFSNGLMAEAIYGKGETFWQSDRTFELYGEAGTLVFEGDRGTLIQDKETPVEVGSRRGLFAKDTEMVLARLLSGTPLYVSPTASHDALKVADATRQSAETGRTIAVNS